MALPGLPDLAANLPFAPSGRLLGRAPEAWPLTPEEEEGLLYRTLGGLEYIGGILDTPGAIVRGIASGLSGGSWGGGLYNLGNLLPFVPDVPLKDRVSGRDLLETWGLAPPNKEGLSHWLSDPSEAGWDIGGFALEVATDPLTMFEGPLKSLTPLGKAARAAKGLSKVDDAVRLAAEARRAGTLTDDVASAPVSAARQYLADTAAGNVKELGAVTPEGIAREIEAGERGLLSVYAPWPLRRFGMNEPLAQFGAGSQTAANLIRTVNYGKFSPIRGLRSVFTPHLQGALNSLAQQQLDVAHEVSRNLVGAAENIAPVVSERQGQLAQVYGRLAGHLRKVGDEAGATDFDDFARRMAERKDLSAAYIEAAFEGADPADVKSFSAQFYAYLEDLKGMKDEAYDRLRALGLRGSDLDDMYVGHFPRRPSSPAAAKAWDAARQRRVLNGSFPYTLRRATELRDTPGGTVTINHAAMDPLYSGTGRRLKHKGKGPLAPGALVKTADGKYGRVTNIEGDRYAIHFQDVSETQYVRNYRGTELTPVDAAPVGVEVPAPLATKDQIIAGIRARLAKRGVETPDDISLEEAQALGLYHERLQPAYQAEVNAGTIAPDDYEPGRLLDGYRRGESISEQDEAGNWIEQELTEDVPGTARQLAGFLRGLGNDQLERGVFDRSVAEDWLDYIEHAARTEANLRVMHGFLGDVVQNTPDDLEGGISLAQAWRRIVRSGRDGQPRTAFTQQGLDSFARNRLAKELGVSPADVTAEQVEEYIQNTQISEEALGALNQYVRSEGPDGESWLGQIWDAGTSLWKAGMTSPWAAFHVRNLVDGQWRWYVAGGLDQSSGLPMFSQKEYWLAFWDVLKYLGGGTDQLDYLDEIKALRVHQGGRLSEVFGAAAPDAAPQPGALKDIVMPLAPTAAGRKARGGFWQAINPFNVRGMEPLGVRQPGQPQNIPVEMGSRAFVAVEDLNRLPAYMALRRKGWTPAQAKELVDTVQYDYSKSTRFERQWMRRLVPFWGFVSRNIPHHFSEVFNRPGGRTAQTIRAISALNRDSDGSYLPGWLREQMAIRWGGPEEQASFIRQFGLSVEDLGSTFAAGDAGFKRTAERSIAKMHPTISFAYQAISGRNPLYGKEQRVTDTLTGNPNLDLILQKLPTGRTYFEFQDFYEAMQGKEGWATTVLDMLTGTKFGAYDLPLWRYLELRDRIDDQLKENPLVREMAVQYVPEKLKGRLDEETAQGLKLSRQVSRRIQQLAKERKRATPAAAP